METESTDGPRCGVGPSGAEFGSPTGPAGPELTGETKSIGEAADTAPAPPPMVAATLAASGAARAPYKVAHWFGSGGRHGVIYDPKVIEALEGMVQASREVPVIEDADLDEEKWLALAAPMTGVPRELWRCSFCSKVNERDVETCECGKDHGLCPIDGSYVCEHGSEHDEWVE